jgi:sigma-E factor negative regulatory protein RseB
MKLLATTCLMVAALVGHVGSALGEENALARGMLERMSTAMSQMSYQGTFVYVQGDDVETMRITHIADEQGVRERLYALSGEPREILRNSTGVRWVLANDQSVFEDPGFNLSFFPELPANQRDLAQDSYSLIIGSEARVASHQARNLKIVPKDGYRYGYSLWLESHSDLLLKWELVDSKGKTLAKLMFTDISLGSEVDEKELRPTRQLKKFKTVESKLPAGRGRSGITPKWQPATLPPGFQLINHRYFGERDKGVFEHLIYSDGLAAVSVYIESIGTGDSPDTGASRIGTTHAYSRTAEDMLITVVGDVPAITVKSIANAVEITLSD